MLRFRPLLLLGLALTALAGCGGDFHARRLITHNDLNDRFKEQVLTGGSQKLLDSGRIARQRAVPVDEDITLDLWLLNTSAAQPLGSLLLVHGLAESRVDMLPLGEKLAAAGFDVILPDLRAHGYSSGEYVTWGALESRDLKALLDVLDQDNALRKPLYVLGVSMGAATAIRLAAIDPRVQGVLSLASYTDAPSVARWLTPFLDDQQYTDAWKRAGELAGFQPRDTSALNVIGQVRCPVVLIHGLMDKVVPYEQATTLLAAATPPKQLITRKLAGHDLHNTEEDWLVDQAVTLAGGTLPAAQTPPPAETAPTTRPAPARPEPTDAAAVLVPIEDSRPTPQPAETKAASPDKPSTPQTDTPDNLAEIETLTVQPKLAVPDTQPASQPATPQDLHQHLPPWMKPD